MNKLLGILLLVIPTMIDFTEGSSRNHSGIQDNPITDNCSSDPCENGGTCVNTNSSYICTCKPGYVGPNCHEINCKESIIVTEVTDIKSPNYPESYPPLKTCLYLLTANEGQLINVSFQDLALGNSAYDCESQDHIAIFDGNNNSSPVIGTYCGNEIPEGIVTTGRHVFIKFRSFAPSDNKGYDIRITPITDDGRPASTRMDYYADGDKETKSLGGRIYSHRSYQNGPDLSPGSHPIDIRTDNIFNQTYFKFLSVKLSKERIQEKACNIERDTGRLGSIVNDGTATKVNSVEECCQSCREAGTCKAFSYDKGSTVDYGSCWLMNDIPMASYSNRFDSGIFTHCDDKLENIKIYDGGKLLDVVCDGYIGKGFVARGRVTLELHLTDTAVTGKGFEAMFALFYPDNNGKCVTNDDIRCPNRRCISAQLRDKKEEYCAAASNILSAYHVLVSWMVMFVVVSSRS